MRNYALTIIIKSIHTTLFFLFFIAKLITKQKNAKKSGRVYCFRTSFIFEMMIKHFGIIICVVGIQVLLIIYFTNVYTIISRYLMPIYIKEKPMYKNKNLA